MDSTLANYLSVLGPLLISWTACVLLFIRLALIYNGKRRIK